MNASFFGFTNDPIPAREIAAWRDAAIADGWTRAALDVRADGTVGESDDRWCKLERDGWVAHVVLRPNPSPKWTWEAKLNVWAPDRLVVPPPGPRYDWNALQAAATRCKLCGGPGGTERYSFAGRCCTACLPAARAKFERPGWDD